MSNVVPIHRPLHKSNNLKGSYGGKGLFSAMAEDREERLPVEVENPEEANLYGSKLADGRHAPIIDLDFPHRYVPSSTEGHAHLYLDVPVSRWRWIVLMWGLYMGGVIQKGYFWWSIRRGANFARTPWAKKGDDE